LSKIELIIERCNNFMVKKRKQILKWLWCTIKGII
jgi:hypothetical protein